MSKHSKARAHRWLVQLGTVVVILAMTAGMALANPDLSGHITYVNWSGGAIDEAVIAAFQEKYPNVTVEMQNRSSGKEYHENLFISIATGVAPDIALVDFYEFPKFVVNNLVMDVTEWAERDGFWAELNQLHPSVLGELQHEGRLYSVANLRTGLDGIYYNKDLFDQSGMAYPPSQLGGWTWDDWADSARRLTRISGSGDVEQWGLRVHEAFLWGFVRSNGGRLFNDDFTRATWDDPATVEALEWLVELTQSSALTWNFMGNNFTAGNVGMNIEWIGGAIQTLRSNVPWDWDIAPWPTGKAGSVATMKGNPVVIPINSPNPELAWEFMKFLGSEEALYMYGREGRFIPLHRNALMRVVQDSVGLPPANLATMLEWNAEALPFVPGFHDIYNMRRTELRPVWNGDIPARSAGITISELSVGILENARP